MLWSDFCFFSEIYSLQGEYFVFHEKKGLYFYNPHEPFELDIKRQASYMALSSFFRIMFPRD